MIAQILGIENSVLEELQLSSVALIDLFFGLLNVLFLLQEGGSKRSHSLEKGVLGQSIVLKKTVELHQTIAFSAAEDCFTQGHHFVNLLILDAKIFQKILFHTRSSLHYRTFCLFDFLSSHIRLLFLEVCLDWGWLRSCWLKFFLTVSNGGWCDLI